MNIIDNKMFSAILGTEFFPLELTAEIFTLSRSNLAAIALVSKQFKNLAEDYAKNHPLMGSFGETEWRRFNGNPGVVPPIPLKLYQLFDPSKHLLTLIPETINDQPVDLKSIDCFIQSYKGNVKSNYSSFLPALTIEKHKSHWFLLSKNIIPDTKHIFFYEQRQIVKAQGFQIPNLIDTVVSLLMHNLKTGEFIYPTESTRVIEKSVWRIHVGRFNTYGLNISYDYTNNSENGVALALGASQQKPSNRMVEGPIVASLLNCMGFPELGL